MRMATHQGASLPTKAHARHGGPVSARRHFQLSIAHDLLEALSELKERSGVPIARVIEQAVRAALPELRARYGDGRGDAVSGDRPKAKARR